MIGGLLGNSGSMPISANGGPATSGANGKSGGSLSVGSINMGGASVFNPSTLMIAVIVIVAVLLWKKK
ncbi:hypothetical protein [Vibrio parahaemolyticus]|nr:hypothetical protein [Vibrio parahaemolyticus]EGQ7654982.1 hypothetical protein [Vibrio parahaemolyticus]EGQ9190596.1 hypothetical protein [Vibrio parahaemolyticus]EGR3354670.1 hypothetical protein [Vibrio parahaemolyticus]EJG1851951.1 hypothetical protein [Vibrio parahaemolyticus]ELC9530947.1 hypothetical protein [Vibrio parahaemolyticus]